MAFMWNRGKMGLCVLLLLIGMAVTGQESGQRRFYEVMQSGTRVAVDKELRQLYTDSGKDKEAYTGALLMKKAGLVNAPEKKLALFRQGHKKLEAAIREDSSRADLRFLRLMIQEHAPAILGYNHEETGDSDAIIRQFPHLRGVLQAAIREYSKHSKIIKPADLDPDK